MNAANLCRSDRAVISDLAKYGRLRSVPEVQVRRLVRRGLVHKVRDDVILAKGAWQAVLEASVPDAPKPKGLRRLWSWLTR